MKKILFVFSLVLLFSLVSPASAYFYRDHEYFVLRGFEDVSSPLTNQCRDHIEAVMNGIEAADVGVIHYFDDKVTSYIGTHQRIGYEACLREAGSDVESRCFCHGIALHIVMDDLAHNDGGIVVEKIKESLGSNFLGHMVVERSFEKGHQEFLEMSGDKFITNGQLDFFDSRVLNMLFEFDESGQATGPSKFMNLLNEAAGIDMEQDARVIRSGYLGEGFFSTVYQDKVSLPFWAWGIGIGFTVVGLGVAIVLLVFGRTNFRFTAALVWFAIAAIGAIIIISFITGTTWRITTNLIEIPAALGYLSVTNQEVITYNEMLKANTNQFLQTEQLLVDDASGLDFIDQNGVFHEGALTRAESGFKFIVLPALLILFAILNIWMFRRSFGLKGFFGRRR